LVEVTGICIAREGRAVLDHVDISVSRGEIVTVVGINGAGKTSLLRAVIGSIQPDTGHIWRRPDLQIGYMPQQLSVDAAMPITVGRFLSLGTGNSSKVRSEKALSEVGAAPLIGQQLAALSGGERQRVMMARAMLREPDLLVLDEPMGSVDVSAQAGLYQLIGNIRTRINCGILLVSHDLHHVMSSTDKVICLNRHVCCTGQPQMVARDPEFIALFGQTGADAIANYKHHHDHRHSDHGEVIPLSEKAPHMFDKNIENSGPQI